MTSQPVLLMPESIIAAPASIKIGTRFIDSGGQYGRFRCWSYRIQCFDHLILAPESLFPIPVSLILAPEVLILASEPVTQEPETVVLFLASVNARSAFTVAAPESTAAPIFHKRSHNDPAMECSFTCMIAGATPSKSADPA